MDCKDQGCKVYNCLQIINLEQHFSNIFWTIFFILIKNHWSFYKYYNKFQRLEKNILLLQFFQILITIGKPLLNLRQTIVGMLAHCYKYLHIFLINEVILTFSQLYRYFYLILLSKQPKYLHAKILSFW
jgi:hypothetical protein